MEDFLGFGVTAAAVDKELLRSLQHCRCARGIKFGGPQSHIRVSVAAA
jgi:hypothetical protein